MSTEGRSTGSRDGPPVRSSISWVRSTLGSTTAPEVAAAVGRTAVGTALVGTPVVGTPVGSVVGSPVGWPAGRPATRAGGRAGLGDAARGQVAGAQRGQHERGQDDVRQVEGGQRARAEAGAHGGQRRRDLVEIRTCAGRAGQLRLVVDAHQRGDRVHPLVLGALGKLAVEVRQRRHRLRGERAQVDDGGVVALRGVRREQQVGGLGGLRGEVVEGVRDLGRVVLGVEARDLVEAGRGAREQRGALALLADADAGLGRLDAALERVEQVARAAPTGPPPRASPWRRRGPGRRRRCGRAAPAGCGPGRGRACAAGAGPRRPGRERASSRPRPPGSPAAPRRTRGAPVAAAPHAARRRARAGRRTGRPTPPPYAWASSTLRRLRRTPRRDVVSRRAGSSQRSCQVIGSGAPAGHPPQRAPGARWLRRTGR